MLATQRLLFGLKRLLLQPALSLPVVLSLGSTLAAVLTVLAIYHALIIRPLPNIRAPEQLSLHHLAVSMGSMQINLINQPLFLNFRRYLQHYGDWAYLVSQPKEMVEIATQQHQLTVLEASAGTAELLGLQLLAGESGLTANAHSGVWISETSWQQLFQRDAAIVGNTVQHQGNTYKIAGVYQDILAIPGSPAPTALQMWRFFGEDAAQNAAKDSFGSGALIVLRGKQQPDDAALKAWLQHAQQDFPVLSMLATQGNIQAKHQDYRQAVLGDSARLIWLLLAVTLTLLLIAALNLTNLLLAHYQSRQQEFAVQLLTGCSVWRLKMLVAVENLSLIIPALLFAVVGSLWLIRSLPVWAGNSLPLLNNIELNAVVVLLFLLLGLLLLLLFSAPLPVPKQLASAFNSSGKGQYKQQSALLVNSLFVGQLLLSSVLICGSALLAYQGYRQIYTDYGFNRVNSYLLKAAAQPEDPRSTGHALTATDEQQYQLRNTLLQQKITQAFPQAMVSNSRQQPIEPAVTILRVVQEHSQLAVISNIASVDNQYFALYGIQLLHGSFFSEQAAQQQIIIDLPTAEMLSSGAPANAVGQQLGDYKIVGVVNAVKSINKMPTSYLFTKAAADAAQRLVVVLPEGESLSVPAVQSALAELAAEYPLLSVESLQQHWRDSTRQTRMHFYLISAITLTSLLLAVLGIAGISQQQSRQKRYELAVRLATGASQQQLLWFTAARSGALLILGLLAGGVLTFLLLGYLSGYFKFINTLSSQHLLVLQLLLLLVAVTALLVPCWQVIRRDPMQSLRHP